eukprot:gene39982-48704_t
MVGILLTSLIAMYPITMEDILINQEVLPVRDQELLTSSFLPKGRSLMERSHLTILGVARDVSPQLSRVLPQLEKLSAYFHSSQVIFVEGDSVDDSFARLQDWANLSPSNRTVLQVSAKNMKDTFGVWAGKDLPREGRIALARNTGLEEYLKHPVPLPSALSLEDGYVLVLDLDIVGFNVNGVIDSFGRRGEEDKEGENWGVVCAQGIILHGIYRDTYALRTPSIFTNHHTQGGDHNRYNISVEQRSEFVEKVRKGRRKAAEEFNLPPRFIFDHLLLRGSAGSARAGGMGRTARRATEEGGNREESVAREQKEGVSLVPVDSCFGGMAIYHAPALLSTSQSSSVNEKATVAKSSCTYAYRSSSPPHMLDCEHVFLHDCLRKEKGVQIFVNPQ